MRRVPKSARYSAADAFNGILHTIIHNGGLPELERLLLFSHYAFAQPASKEKRTVSLTTLVKPNLARPTNLVTAHDAASLLPKATTSKQQEAVSMKMNAGDVSGAVRLLSSEDAVVTPSPEVLDILKT
ncbi:hypothetical protein BV898_00763 [Hypsibius exemplaris]|uniref:Uncharacterized protein n=1 Tax=Hypsibius exemplaris TaxID=2072580 RepID=A0A1W0XEL0_HYPEX|nr:hypothetical protein BV898_00763 [Hypsibius exemplaris]